MGQHKNGKEMTKQIVTHGIEVSIPITCRGGGKDVKLVSGKKPTDLPQLRCQTSCSFGCPLRSGISYTQR